MTTQNPQRKTYRTFILVFAAVIFGYTIYQELKPHYEVGQMEYRLVTGSLDGLLQVIMIETSSQITVLFPDFKEIFENNDAELVSRSEQLEMLQNTNDLQYRVSFNLPVKGEKAEFRLSRENFNLMKFNREIKFEVDRKVRDSISSIVAM